MPELQIELPDRNTKLTIPSLGEVELKFISMGDSQRFLEIIHSNQDVKQATLKMLHSQLVSPIVSLEDFIVIPEEDMLKILKAFVSNEKYIFESFDHRADPFEAFVRAFKEGRKKRIEEMAKILMPNYEAVSKSLVALATQIQPISITPSMQSIVNNALGQTNIMKSLSASNLGFSKRLIEAQTSALSSISKIVAPNVKIWQGWAKRNAELFRGTTKILQEFQKKYRIAESEAIQVLAKYKWFVSPSIPITVIYAAQQLNKRKGNQSRAVNKLFIDYFERDNWAILDMLLEKWKDNHLFTSRYKILSDTFKMIQLGGSSDINIVNATLPTLIVQVDGILKDFMKENVSVSFNDHNKIKTLKDSGLIQPASDLDDLGMTVFLDILFQSSNPGTPLHTPFNLNRHKILHAENTRYGRKDYLVRVLMVLDILAHLKVQETDVAE